MVSLFKRSIKGSPLTHQEMDSNWTALDVAVETKADKTGANATGNWPINVTGTATNVTGVVALAKGGTGASTAAGARAAIGLDQVNNTSDSAKPISTPQAAALGTKADKLDRNAQEGYPGLTNFALDIMTLSGSVKSSLSSLASAARSYVLPDKGGIVAMMSDIEALNSGTNTGDETTATILQKLGITSISGTNTGDQTLASLGIPNVQNKSSTTILSELTSPMITAALSEGILTIQSPAFPQLILRDTDQPAEAARYAVWLEADGTMSLGSQSSLSLNTRVMNFGRTGAGHVAFGPSFNLRNTVNSEVSMGVSGLVGYGRVIKYSSSDVVRWTVGANASAEVGGNAGSDYSVNRFNDAGVLIDNPFVIARATGQASFTLPPVVGTLVATDNSTKSASSAWVRSLFGINNGIASLDGTGKLVTTQLPSFTGDITTAAGATATTLSATGVVANTYGSSSNVAVFTVDAKGRLSAASSVAISPVAIGAVPSSTLGVANGVATLGSDGKLTASQLPDSLMGGLNYLGTWNASTNTPTIVSGSGVTSDYYKVSVAGTSLVDGQAYWQVGDLVLFNGTTWDRVEGGATEVTSVAGRVGAVVLAAADISGLAASATTNTTNAANISSGTLPAGRLPAFGGDLTSAGGTAAVSLANSGVAAASYGSASMVPTFTVDAKGRLTVASQVAVAPSFANITGKPTTLAGYGITDAASSAGAVTAGSFINNETPAGVIDGANTTFTLANTPNGMFQLFSNGVLQEPGGADYTLTGATITMTVAPINAPPAKLRAYYTK